MNKYNDNKKGMIHLGMAGFGFFGALLLYVFGLFILYLIIQAAVRNAIDNSETGKMIRKYLKEKTRIDVTKDD